MTIASGLAALGVGAILGLAGAGASAESQAPRDSSAILAAAITSVRPYAPSVTTGIGFADSLRIGDARAAEIARTVGYAHSALASKRVCSGPTPSYCHLVGLKVFIEPTGLEIDGDRAEVFLTVLDETTSHRQPIHYAFFEVRLARSGSTWRPTNVRVLGDS